MPYRVRKQGSGYILQHLKEGHWRVKSHHKTKGLAEAAQRLLYQIESGRPLTRPRRRNPGPARR